MGDDNAHQDGLASIVSSVEGILKYNFRNKKLLEDALTHPSLPETTSFNSLEFLGDSVLGLAVSNFVFITYPSLHPGQLTLLRACNVSSEKLARVAVRHGFYRFVRHCGIGLITGVQKFVLAVMEEDETLPFGGVVRAPKVLSSIVHSIAGAVYVDCGFDLKALWLVFRGLLEPIVTWETLREHDRPVTALHELCLAQGKHLKLKECKMDNKHFISVCVDGELVTSASSHQLEIARVIAAREALRTFGQASVSGGGTCGFTSEVDERNEVVAAKLKLSNICVKQKWPEPSYRVEKEEGQSDVKKYICSVRVEVEEEVLVMHGFQQSTMEDAENSAASFMICSLLAQGHVQRICRKRRRKSSIRPKGDCKDVGDEIKIKRPASGEAGKEDQHQETRVKKNSSSSKGNDKDVGDEIKIRRPASGDVEKEDQHQDTRVKKNTSSSKGNDKDVGDEVKLGRPASGDVEKEDQHQETRVRKNSSSSKGNDKDFGDEIKIRRPTSGDVEKEDQHQETRVKNNSSSPKGNDKDVGDEIKRRRPASGDGEKEDQHQETRVRKNSISSKGKDREMWEQKNEVSSYLPT